MEVWLFDIMQWPYRQWEIPYPFPGTMYDRELPFGTVEPPQAMRSLELFAKRGPTGTCAEAGSSLEFPVSSFARQDGLLTPSASLLLVAEYSSGMTARLEMR